MPLVALCLIVLFGFAALAIDAGYLEYKQRLQQTAADSAAIAGGWALIGGADVTTAAQRSTAANGFTHDGTTVIVSATTPPATGPNTGNTSAVEVHVTANYPAIFSGIFGRSQNAVSTRAVAVVQNNPAGPCIWALAGDFSDNQGSVNGPCGILVSKDVQNNGATMTIPSIGAEGHVSNSPSGVVVSEGIPPFNDPCPTIPGCKALTALFPLGSTPGAGPYVTCSKTAPTSGSSLIGGCYPSMSGTFNLAPGLYIVQGDFSATLTCTTCISGDGGAGVTIVVGGKVNLNGSTTAIIAPPNFHGAGNASVTTAGAPGVLIYQTSTSTNPENFSAQSLLGMLYVPRAHINLNGGRSTLTITYVVAADIVANKADIGISAGSIGNPVQVPVLAE